jgi:hypothetical protein
MYSEEGDPEVEVNAQVQQVEEEGGRQVGEAGGGGR